MINKITQGIDDILNYIASKEMAKEVANGLSLYKKPFNQLAADMDLEEGFNTWLIHDYVTTKGKTLSEMVLEDDAVKEAIKSSVFSVFVVNVEKQQIVFKDLITSVDYVVQTEQLFESGDLVSIRLYPTLDGYVIVDNPYHYDQSMESVIRKSVMAKYNEYCSANEPVSIEVFIKRHSQLIYHLKNIIHFYETEAQEEVYTVFVAEYSFKDRDTLLDELLDTNYFQIIETYEDEMTLVLLDDGIQIAEVLVTSHKMEVEVNQKEYLRVVKDIIDRCSNEAIFIKESELSLDDLLQ